jgi:hypothetical protein
MATGATARVSPYFSIPRINPIVDIPDGTGINSIITGVNTAINTFGSLVVYVTATQAIANAANNIFNLTGRTVVCNPNSAYTVASDATGLITVPSAGYYKVRAGVYCTSTVLGAASKLKVQVNSVDRSISSQTSITVTSFYTYVEEIIYVASTAEQIRISMDGTGSTTLSTALSSGIPVTIWPAQFKLINGVAHAGFIMLERVAA